MGLAIGLLGSAPGVLADRGREILEAAGVEGGLVVHLGCGDGELTAQLRAGDGYLVHGLDPDPAKVARARARIRSLGLYGAVSVDRLRGARLPYAEGIVNLLVSEERGAVPYAEILRVLSPGAKAYLREGERWTTTVKPWPGDIDEWTHFLHGPDGNAVAHDRRVGPPRHVRWVGKPRFARAHEQLASLSACVTSGGRIFSIMDETPAVDIRIPARFALVARDAFSGVVLWRRPIEEWADQLRRFRAGPPDLPFRLVAAGNRLYVTLGVSAPVSGLDAATGRALFTVEGSEGTRQILRLDDGLIILADSAPQTNALVDSRVRQGLQEAVGKRAILAADPTKGDVLWRHEIRSFVHPTVAAGRGRLVLQTTRGLVSLDLATGAERWRAPVELYLRGHELGWEMPTLLVHEGLVFSAGFRRLSAFSLEDGRERWSRPAVAGYNSPPDLFVTAGLLWVKGAGERRLGLDPASGEVRRQLTAPKGYMHHRCYRDKATDRFLLLGNQGVQFLDVASGKSWRNYWVRGTCQYGVMPANGLLYVTPDSCACNLKTKLNGFWALAASRAAAPPQREAERLEKGPAFGAVQPPAGGNDRNDWPIYRADPARSGRARAPVASDLRRLWKTPLGGRISSPTAAAGRVFVASIDAHAVHALDADTGRVLWSFVVGGRVDTPPTYDRGRLIFGSADGRVYSLRARGGALEWSFRAAPESRLVFVRGQLESVWPVHGSVLVRGGEAIVAAGRSSYLDGGIHLLRLGLATGKLLGESVVYSPDRERGEQPAGGKELRGLLSDIISADGGDLYMRHVKLDLATGAETGTGRHLFSPVGLLDDTWWHRGYWVYNETFQSHWSGWWRVGNEAPSGRILVLGDAVIYGFGRDKYPGGNTGQWRGGEKYRLFACDRNFELAASPERRGRDARRGDRGKQAPPPPAALRYRWTRGVPVLARAMVLAGDVLFVAGPPDVARTRGPSGEEALVLENPAEVLAAWRGERGGSLLAVSARDGKLLSDRPLDAPPVFDGMAAARGRLYLASTRGEVECWGKR